MEEICECMAVLSWKCTTSVTHQRLLQALALGYSSRLLRGFDRGIELLQGREGRSRRSIGVQDAPTVLDHRQDLGQSGYGVLEVSWRHRRARVNSRYQR